MTSTPTLLNLNGPMSYTFKSLKGACHLVRTDLGGEGIKSPIHFHCILHAKRGEGVQIACKIAYVLDGRPNAVMQ